MLLQLVILLVNHLLNKRVSIPQAVGVVATKEFFVSGILNSNVSIPQAVGVVAT